MIIVSACLAGVNCRYDGKNSRVPRIEEMVRSLEAVPVCPEQLGGLSTPRPPSEIRGGDGRDVISGAAGVFNSAGEDVTESYLKGAREALKIALMVSAGGAVMKEKSPACGSSLICKKGRKAPGMGVCSAMLAASGIVVCGEGEV